MASHIQMLIIKLYMEILNITPQVFPLLILRNVGPVMNFERSAKS